MEATTSKLARRVLHTSTLNCLKKAVVQRSKVQLIPEIPLGPVDFERLHLEVAENHARLGSRVYSQSVGDTKIIWIADASMSEAVYRSETRTPHHPMPVRPESWLEFNQCQNVKRGLLFEDGSEWYETRRRMNPIFLGPRGLTLDVVRDDAIADIRD